jgi:predicted permease
MTPSGPDVPELDEEIRGHLALAVQDRVERGEDPEAARGQALREFGNVLLTRESMETVWRPRWVEWVAALGSDLGAAVRSLGRAKGLVVTVAATLALGIGANTAVFSVVRQVLFQPLANRDADRLVYIRQSAPGLGSPYVTFSMPEIADLRAGAKTIAAFGDFSSIDLTLVGFGEPRVVKAGIVSGSYFEVMGLRPALGRLIGPGDDGPEAAGAVVLTHRFWSEAVGRDPGVVGRTIRIGTRPARVVGVLEPSVPYPDDTEIVANVVTSPHHLGAVMVESRTHRMTELFGRLAEGATVEEARADLAARHAAMVRAHPEAYAADAGFTLSVTPLHEHLTAPARPVLLLLLGASALVFLVACSNVANLVLARSVRRERELLVRATLGASRAALRRTLLAESLVLCGAGAALGVAIAYPFLHAVSRFAARFSVRAHEVRVEQGLLSVGVSLALVAAVALAYVPRLPSPGPASGRRRSPRASRGAWGRLRVLAAAQIAFSFVLLAGAFALLQAFAALQSARPAYDLGRVLAVDVPLPLETAGKDNIRFFRELTRRAGTLPGVAQVAVGSFVPWRDVNPLMPLFSFAVQGQERAEGEEEPRARLRIVSPGFFATVGLPLRAGRDFTDRDATGEERVVVVSESLARRAFPGGDALDRRLWWTDPYFGAPTPRRIVGVVADLDDQNLVPAPALTVYHPLGQIPYGSRLFVRAEGDPYALVAPLRRLVRELLPDQPMERAATLSDVRAEVMAPERLSAFVVSGFAGVALLVAVVGVAGVLAFTVSARMQEFGVRLAIGSGRRRLLGRVLLEGVRIAVLGTVAGLLGFAFLAWAASSRAAMPLPGGLPLLGAASVLVAAAVVASLMPAVRASRVDVVQALRAE